MNHRRISLSAAAVVAVLALCACKPAAPAGGATPELSDGHPDLSGVWAPKGMAFKVADNNGSVDITYGGGGAAPTPRNAAAEPNTPKYKPEFRDKVADFARRQDFIDPVFTCGRPGVPRLGPPVKIMHTANEIVLLYQHYPVGDFFRVVPTKEGAAYHDDLEPTFNGDAVGRWEDDTLVIESRNFVPDSWFGEDGYIHSPNMRVVERFRREGDSLTYSAQVIDPDMLEEPWTKPQAQLSISDTPIVESPPCTDISRPLLSTEEHH